MRPSAPRRIAWSFSDASSWPASPRGAQAHRGCASRSRAAPAAHTQRAEPRARPLHGLGRSGLGPGAGVAVGLGAGAASAGGRPNHARLRVRRRRVGQDRPAGARAPALPRRVIRPGHSLVSRHRPLEVRRAVEGSAPCPRTTTAARSTSRRSAASRSSATSSPAASSTGPCRTSCRCPSALQPSQVISLLDLSGPSFRLPDHGDHLHVGY